MVAGQGLVMAAAAPTAQQESMEERDVVKDERIYECCRTKNFTLAWELQFKKPGVAGQTGAEQRVADGNDHKISVKPSVNPTVWNHVGPVANGTTKAVKAESAVVKEVADVTRLGGHSAEDVGAAGGEGVQADQQHVDQQRPGVAL